MASAMTDTDIQKIVVTLEEPDIVVEPGSSGAQLIVTMTNRQDSPDRLALEIEGVDVEWYNIPMSAFNVAPGAQATARITFKVARSNENRADSYPFLVRVQAMETGEVGMAQGMLIIKPFSSLELEVSPKRAVSTFANPLNDFDVTVTNQGNSEETLELYASDPEDACAYEFDTDRITLKPGQAQIVPLAARPKVSSVIGGMRLYGFTITSRSVKDSYVSATVHGQIEKHALISPLLGIFLLLLTFGGFGWYWFHPRPPLPIHINRFEATETQVSAGAEVTLTWDASAPADSEFVLFKRVTQNGKDGVDVAEGVPQRSSVGSIQVKPDPLKTVYTLVGRRRDGSTGDTKTLTIVVAPPLPSPKPTIKFFQANPTKIHEGDSTLLSWDARGAVRLFLDPGSVKLDQYAQSQMLTPTQDITEYKLRAYGANPNDPPAEKKVTVRVFPKDICIAEVTKFTGPKTAYIGDKVTLRWKTAYAKTAQIVSDKGFSQAVKPGEGKLEVPITETTTFTLTLTDSANLTTTQVLTVEAKERPLPTEAPPSSVPTDVTPPATGTNLPPGGPPPPR